MNTIYVDVVEWMETIDFFVVSNIGNTNWIILNRQRAILGKICTYLPNHQYGDLHIDGLNVVCDGNYLQRSGGMSEGTMKV